MSGTTTLPPSSTNPAIPGQNDPETDAAATARGARPPKKKPLPYEGASAKRLAEQPARPGQMRPKHVMPEWSVVRQHSEARLNMLRSWRLSWMQHFQILETYILPRRGIFINTAQPTPNSMIRGMPINTEILDPTGTYAMRRCAAGLMSNEMAPSRQWFKIKPALTDRDQAAPDAIAWFDEVEDRISTVFQRSNFYQEAPQMFEDLTTFGTGPMILYDDPDDLLRAYTPCCGEYFLASSSSNRVDVLYRLFNLTVSAIVEMFGLENCPRDVQKMWQDKGGALDVEMLVAHAIEPNFAIFAPNAGDECGVIPGDFTYREVYWCYGKSNEWPLSSGGYIEKPFIAPRWSVTSNDPYGRSVGMDVLPDIISLQVESGRYAEALEKTVRPPMVASVDMKNEPQSVLPGKVTYVSGIDPSKGFRPAFQINPDLAAMSADVAQKQNRIKEGFFNDLFAMLEQLGDKRMTAYEVSARNQERLQVLGPIVERLQGEALGPAIKRVFKILWRKNMLPPMPQSLHGVPLGIEYMGVLALAAKAANSATLERIANTAGAMAQFKPEVLDLLDGDEWMRQYADDLSVPGKILRSPDQVAAIRQQRAQQQQAAQQLQAANAAAQTAKTASDVDVGGGLNAISMMTGFGPSPSGNSAAG